MIKVTERKSIFVSWISWHYVIVLQEILLRWQDFLRFSFNYFSVFRLMQTFFSPWHKYQTSYGRGFDIKRYAEIIIFNTFSRLIGMAMRMMLIIIGIFAEIFVAFVGFFLLFFWVLIPFIVSGGLFLSIKWILSSI